MGRHRASLCKRLHSLKAAFATARIAPTARDYARSPMVGNTSSQRAITPPKGRPTRPRTARYYRKRVFGSTAQWIAAAIILVLAFVVLMMVAY